jgi:hypothetical protein
MSGTWSGFFNGLEKKWRAGEEIEHYTIAANRKRAVMGRTKESKSEQAPLTEISSKTPSGRL